MLFDASSQRFHRAARLALAAMVLLTVGPLIGQLSAFGSALHHHGATHGAVADHPHAAQGAGWHAACGYCTLFQQLPVLDMLRLRILKARCLATAAPVPATLDAQGARTTFPNALSRAPPIITS